MGKGRMERGSHPMRVSEFACLGHPAFWKAYWVTMRPYLLFVSAAAGMVGFAEESQANIQATLAVFLVFFLSYGFGQALTDVFQLDTDSISSPYRPLVQGLIGRRQVLAISLVGLTLCCVILVLLNPWSFIPGILCVFGLATYTPFKRRWWAGPFYNAWIVALLPVLGKMAASGAPFSLTLFSDGPFLFFVMSVFFSYANFVLMGYFKDISADRASGYKTFVVAFGWNRAAVVSDILALFSVLTSAWGISRGLGDGGLVSSRGLGLALFGGAVMALGRAQFGIHRVRTEQEAYRPIAYVVRGFILLHLAEIGVLRPDWIPFAILFYILFEGTLRQRPEKKQV